MTMTLTNADGSQTQLTAVSVRKVITYEDGSKQVLELIGNRIRQEWLFLASDKKALRQFPEYV